MWTTCLRADAIKKPSKNVGLEQSRNHHHLIEM
jgi:hypothetical protein